MDYSEFKNDILSLTGIDLNLYKENQMKRRIDTLIMRRGLSGYDSFIKLLHYSKKDLQHFMGYITINVSEFFRTPEHWKCLEETVLAKRSKLRIWSTACSTGQEPYSLVMSLAEHIPLEDIHVLATDIDKESLTKAREGIFTEVDVMTVPKHYLTRYFECVGDNYKIKEEVRSRVEFRQMDILRQELPTDLDLIVCRNVMIYFTQEAKDKLYHDFYDSLAPGGYLFTGNTEQILQYKSIGYEKIEKFLYQKL